MRCARVGSAMMLSLLLLNGASCDPAFCPRLTTDGIAWKGSLVQQENPVTSRASRMAAGDPAHRGPDHSRVKHRYCLSSEDIYGLLTALLPLVDGLVANRIFCTFQLKGNAEPRLYGGAE